MKRWWKQWKWARDMRNFEVYVFNFGPIGKWQRVRDLNTLAKVWERYPL
jgi:hypothetical protein